MPISLTKEEMLERFSQRQSQFADAIGKSMRPELPFTIESYDDLAGRCSLVVSAFIETVFAEDEKKQQTAIWNFRLDSLSELRHENSALFVSGRQCHCETRQRSASGRKQNQPNANKTENFPA